MKKCERYIEIWGKSIGQDQPGNWVKIVLVVSSCGAGRRSVGRLEGRCRLTIVDAEVHLDLVFYCLVHNLRGILDHLRRKCFASEEPIKPSHQRPGSQFLEAQKQLFQKA